MTVRTSMADLISRLRFLINDPAGASAVFSDQELQDLLDVRGVHVRYARLTPQETILPGGTVAYYDYYAAIGHWEADEELVDASYNELTPETSERLVGRWSFAQDTPPPVYLSGKAYDLYAAAADALEAWAAREKLNFDFSADGSDARRSQKVQAMLNLAGEYRRRQWPQVARQVRGDVH